MSYLHKIGVVIFLSFVTNSMLAQKYAVNYDEDKVKPYQLPELLVTEQGDTTPK